MRKITELKDNWFFVKNAEDVQEATAARRGQVFYCRIHGML